MPERDVLTAIQEVASQALDKANTSMMSDMDELGLLAGALGGIQDMVAEALADRRYAGGIASHIEHIAFKVVKHDPWEEHFHLGVKRVLFEQIGGPPTFGTAPRMVGIVTDQKADALYPVGTVHHITPYPDTRTRISSFQDEVGAWTDEVFGNGAEYPGRVLLHLREEVAELEQAVRRGDGDPREEAADCFLLLCALAHSMGFNLLHESEKKHEVNRSRIWRFSPVHGYAKGTE